MLNHMWSGDATLLALPDDWQDDLRFMLTARTVPTDRAEAVLDGVAALLRSWTDKDAVVHVPDAFDVVRDALWSFGDSCGNGPGTREATAVIEELKCRGFTVSHPALVTDEDGRTPWFVMTPHGWHVAIEKVLVDQGLTEEGDQRPTEFTQSFLYFLSQYGIRGGYTTPKKAKKAKSS